DAEWVWAWPTSASLCAEGGGQGPTPRAQRRVLVQMTSGAPPAHLPSPTETGMSSDHVYTYTITGAGAPAVFRVDDTLLDDNYGELRILIFPSDTSEPGRS